jgi:hypothetical protein
MTENLCPSNYSREREGDAVTYTCVREPGHPGVHRSDVTENLAAVDVYTGRPTGAVIVEHVMWTDWEAFLAVQRTGADADVLAAGAALVAGDGWYGDMLGRQARYAALVAA